MADEAPAPPALRETLKIACFGANSTGKTLNIARLVEGVGAENVGVISIEHGLSTIASYLKPEQVFVTTGIQHFREEALAWVARRYAGATKWVCVDGGTRLLQWNAGRIWGCSDLAYEELVFNGKRRSDLKDFARYGSRFITSQGEIDGYAQWKEIAVQAESIFNAVIKIPCNWYWTFWEDLTGGDDRKKTLPWQADAPGKGSREAIYGTFDFILRMTYLNGRPIATHDPNKHEARTKARDDWHGGVRVKEVMDDFNLGVFVKSLSAPQQAASAAGGVK